MIHVFYSVVEELNDIGLLEDELKGEVLRILLYRHRYVGAGASFGSGLASGLRKSRASFASFAVRKSKNCLSGFHDFFLFSSR